MNAGTRANEAMRMNAGSRANEGMRMNAGTRANEGMRMNAGTRANEGLRVNAGVRTDDCMPRCVRLVPLSGLCVPLREADASCWHAIHLEF